LDKDKEIRFFECIGDYRMTGDEEEEIINERRQLAM
jgi:hypothetical protein